MVLPSVHKGNTHCAHAINVTPVPSEVDGRYSRVRTAIETLTTDTIGATFGVADLLLIEIVVPLLFAPTAYASPPDAQSRATLIDNRSPNGRIRVQFERSRNAVPG